MSNAHTLPQLRRIKFKRSSGPSPKRPKPPTLRGIWKKYTTWLKSGGSLGRLMGAYGGLWLWNYILMWDRFVERTWYGVIIAMVAILHFEVAVWCVVRDAWQKKRGKHRLQRIERRKTAP